MSCRATLLALALWCGLVAGAQAQVSGEFVGYVYPSVASAQCSPLCTGISVSFNVPTFSGGSAAFAWVGIQNNSGDGTICNLGPCLGQFGIEFTGGSVTPFYEFVCSTGTGCQAAQTITGLSISPGDTLLWQAVCTTACNGTASDQVAVTITDVTTGNVCYVISTGTHCGTIGSTLNWPLFKASTGNFLYYVIEGDGIVTWTPAARFSGATYTTGPPGSQVTFNTPLSPLMASWNVGSGGGSGKTISPSGPIGAGGNDFTICAPVTSASYNPCSASGYSASIMGP